MWSKPLAAAAFIASVNAAATFPSIIDEIEDLLFLQTGYRSRGFHDIVTPCSKEAFSGFNNAAGIIRTAFHDIAAHDKDSGSDGLDASIGYELMGDFQDKNAGPGFLADMVYFSGFFNAKASMADLLALGVVAAVKSCDGPDIALKAGRTDASSAGAVPLLPDPAESPEKLTGRFDKMGFSPQEMIQLVACGHTLGSVHSGVSSGFDPRSQQQIAQAGAAQKFPFDTSAENPASFDNLVAVEYCSAPDHSGSINQLVRDPNRNRASDQKVFDVDKADGENFGPTILSMASSNNAYLAQCQAVLGKMLDTVPSSVSLSDKIEPYDVKPVQIDLNVQPDGTIGVVAEIRVRDGAVGGSVSHIELIYTGSGSDACTEDCVIPLTQAIGNAQGFAGSFTFYKFAGKVPSISSYSVKIDGRVFDNNGQGFPVNDNAFIQTASSTTTGSSIELVVAVRGKGQSPSVKITEPEGYQFNTLPKLSESSESCSPICSGSKWSFYRTSFDVNDANTAKIDLLSNGQTVDEFRVPLFGSNAAEVTCQDTATTTSSSSTTTQTSSTLTTTSATSSETTSSGETTSTQTTSDGETTTSGTTTESSEATTTSAGETSSTRTTSDGETTTSGTTTESSEATTTSHKGDSTTSEKTSATTGTGSTKSGPSNTSKGGSSTTPKGSSLTTSSKTWTDKDGKPTTKPVAEWKPWTVTSEPIITNDLIVPTKPVDAEEAFNSAVASVVEKLNAKPAVGIDTEERVVPGLDLDVYVPHVKPTQSVVTQVYTQTIVYVAWDSASSKPTGQPVYGSPKNGDSPYNGSPASGQWNTWNTNTWVSVPAQASAAPASTWQTWAASATSTGPVKAYTGGASSMKVGSFLIGSAAFIAGAALLL